MEQEPGNELAMVMMLDMVALAIEIEDVSVLSGCASLLALLLHKVSLQQHGCLITFEDNEFFRPPSFRSPSFWRSVTVCFL
jgi:hypothetical protein